MAVLEGTEGACLRPLSGSRRSTAPEAKVWLVDDRFAIMGNRDRDSSSDGEVTSSTQLINSASLSVAEIATTTRLTRS